MSSVPSAAYELMRRQHGVIARAQLLELGLSSRQLEHLAVRGELRSLIRGAAISPSVEVTETARCAALCLVRERIAIAGPTAGRLWGLRRLLGDMRIHSIARRHWHIANVPWCVPCRTEAMRDSDRVHRPDGITVTSLARTVLDVSRFGRRLEGSAAGIPAAVVPAVAGRSAAVGAGLSCCGASC